MPTSYAYPSDWFFLLLIFVMTMMLLYEAWVNIINQDVSRFSFDAILLFLLQRIGTKRTKQNALAFPRKKANIIILGIFMLIAGLYGVQQIISWFNSYILR